MNDFTFLTPDSLGEALRHLQEYGDDAKVMAGGTALTIMMKQRLVMPDVLISLHRVQGLNTVAQADGALHLGGLLTHRSAENAPLLQSELPVLAETFAHVATVRVRNMATLGGSLAHADPNQDPPITLLALGAQVRISSANGDRLVPLDAFFTDYYETVLEPEELVTAIHVPVPAPHSASVYLKFLPRSADDYATVGVAATIQLNPSTGACEACRIAMGCVGVTPLRATDAEALIRGQQRGENLLREAGEAAKLATDPISDTRGSADYKRAMAGVFVKRAVDQAWRQAQASVA